MPAQNKLLASLSPDSAGLLASHLAMKALTALDVLFEAGKPTDRAYFVHSGAVSLVVKLDDGKAVEVATVGSEGVVGASGALDDSPALSKAIVRISGHASVISVEKLREAAHRSEALRNTLIRHDRLIFAQAQQVAACNAAHRADQRLARWLLRAADLSGSENLAITQEYAADILGVRRTTICAVSQTMQKQGLIRNRRRSIEIINREGLRHIACECYESVKTVYDDLLEKRNDANTPSAIAAHQGWPEQGPA